MRRRTLLKGILVASTGPLVCFGLPLARAAGQADKVFVFMQADGGWAPTSFCDPKSNVPDEPVINHWAECDEMRQAGNIPYAPFANNAAFFEKYYGRMLVINGVDAQTNSHTVGIVHNWSGRNSEGYPTTTALLAAAHGREITVPYLSFGGFSRTAGVARFTRVDNANLLRNIATPERASWDGEERYLSDEDWSDLEAYRREVAARLEGARNVMPMDALNRSFYASAFASAEGLKAFASEIPDDEALERPVSHSSVSGLTLESDLRRQAQLAVLVFKTGVAVSADLWLGGFDTHATHDPDQGWLMGNLTDSVDYLWDYAEQHGVADRMVVVMGSDFGRTNFYNSQNGKDHWPIGSYVIMEKGQRWTNRVIGETDDLHFAQRINPGTLQRDDMNGTIIYPKHMHKALRRYLGIENSAGAQRFPFNSTEDFAFFG